MSGKENGMNDQQYQEWKSQRERRREYLVFAAVVAILVVILLTAARAQDESYAKATIPPQIKAEPMVRYMVDVGGVQIEVYRNHRVKVITPGVTQERALRTLVREYIRQQERCGRKMAEQ
jgi:hypothetical protein